MRLRSSAESKQPRRLTAGTAESRTAFQPPAALRAVSAGSRRSHRTYRQQQSNTEGAEAADGEPTAAARATRPPSLPQRTTTPWPWLVACPAASEAFVRLAAGIAARVMTPSAHSAPSVFDCRRTRARCGPPCRLGRRRGSVRRNRTPGRASRWQRGDRRKQRGGQPRPAAASRAGRVSPAHDTVSFVCESSAAGAVARPLRRHAPDDRARPERRPPCPVRRPTRLGVVLRELPEAWVCGRLRDPAEAGRRDVRAGVQGAADVDRQGLRDQVPAGGRHRGAAGGAVGAGAGEVLRADRPPEPGGDRGPGRGGRHPVPGDGVRGQRDAARPDAGGPGADGGGEGRAGACVPAVLPRAARAARAVAGALRHQAGERVPEGLGGAARRLRAVEAGDAQPRQPVDGAGHAVLHGAGDAAAARRPAQRRRATPSTQPSCRRSR